MWPPPEQTSSSSSGLHSSSSSTSIPPTRKTMEDVWKDITLSTPISDHHLLHRTHHPAASGHGRITTSVSTTSNCANSPSSFRGGVILQDFLARPFQEIAVSAARQPPPPAASASSAAVAAHRDMDLFSSPLPIPPPATVLSLNSGLDFQYMESMMQQRSRPSDNSGVRSSHHPNHSSSFIAPTTFSDTVASPAPGLFSYCSKRRMLEQEDPQNGGAGGGDRRHKRMIKNRESAARSRARKQAYTNELELEVAHLAEENANLRRQHEELRKTMAAQLPTKNTLQRSSTAPF